MRRFSTIFALVIAASPCVFADEISFRSLLDEMTDRSRIALVPSPAYRCLQASSYNRESVAPRGSEGWYADSDGTGFIREEENSGRHEWAIMEHEGPGCLTRMWTPYFYYDLNNHRGPKIRIYLDHSDTPAIDEYFIELLTRGEYTGAPGRLNDLQVPHPLAAYTARAGDLYLPIPFARHCKITLDEKPFYYVINYRAYPAGTRVRTWSLKQMERSRDAIAQTCGALSNAANDVDGRESAIEKAIAPGETVSVQLPEGGNAVRHLEIRLGPDENTRRLRSTVLRMTFDGEETVWAPVGDFFCSGNAVNAFTTWEREMRADGTMVCRWVMPYQKSAVVALENLAGGPVDASVRVRTEAWEWTEASMHFHANWRTDRPVAGTPFQDWNFIDIRGTGVFVGDAWTVLCADTGWWGEGDEKIYIDDDYDTAQFPTHFGTGSEDYYGWAGGEMPTGKDAFSAPFVSNVRVGNPANPRGYNICTRSRALDAIPFASRLRFDMEASFGVQMRNPWDLLQYSVVTYWYARPGATHNRPPDPENAARPVMTVEELDAHIKQVRETS
ncbi:MAG: DUF2961 domain-containing protein [Candidatus Hydrogenedentes bacterium]|nr:DUF2961 domain-containing protein [Candidatus Hydrogenedentota bacterium]